MGTSGSYGGPASSTPLVPSWLGSEMGPLGQLASEALAVKTPWGRAMRRGFLPRRLRTMSRRQLFPFQASG